MLVVLATVVVAVVWPLLTGAGLACRGWYAVVVAVVPVAAGR